MIELIFGVINQLLHLVDGVISRRKYIRTLSEQLETSRQLTHELNSFLIQIDAARIVLLRANNGGGLPRYGRPHYVSMVDYVTRQGYLSENARFKEQMIDDWYREHIVKMEAEGSLVVNTSDLPTGSLRIAYEDHHVIRAVWLPILELPKEYWFVAIHITQSKKINEVTDRCIACRQQIQSVAAKLLRKVTL